MAATRQEDLRDVGRVFAARLDADLPDHLEITEDEDFVVLRCRRCPWAVVFSARGPTARELAVLVSEEHQTCDAPMRLQVAVR